MKSRRRAGFSLIELMVVLVVGGIMLGMTLPALNRYLTRGNVRNAADILEGEMRLARQRAVANDVRGWVYFSPGTNYYWTGEQVRTNPTTWSGSIAWKGPVYLPERLIVSSAVFGGANYFFYGPDGRPSLGGPPISGQCVVVSTVGGQPDTARVYLDLSGSVWR